MMNLTCGLIDVFADTSLSGNPLAVVEGEKDADFAMAHAALADCYIVLGGVGNAPGHKMLAKARAPAVHAVKADADLAEAQNSLAYARIYEGDWTGAEAGFFRALELNPGSWITHDWYALALSAQGRSTETLKHNRRPGVGAAVCRAPSPRGLAALARTPPG